MTPAELIARVRSAPQTLAFAEMLDTIDHHYRYTPTAFANGLGADCVRNPAGVNEGSCRVLAFARLHRLSAAETLALFAEHYRSVLADPALPAPDVIYLDPMFPGEGRTALPRRELQLLRELTGDDDTGAGLLALARARARRRNCAGRIGQAAGGQGGRRPGRARRRVVVKRPLHAPTLAPDTSLVFKGRAVRFDVYLIAGESVA